MIQTFYIETLDSPSRDSIHQFCLNLETRFEKEGMGDTIYNVVQELINNAVKANLKRSFFNANDYSFEDEHSYAAGLAAFKTSLRTISEEERRLRSHLARAMEVRNLVQFSEAYGDDTEGAGLGLALVIMLIKDMGFDPDYFRVFTRGDSTVARLEFPLKKDYVPIRKKWLDLKQSRPIADGEYD